jgi:signal recognition particle subunit SRP54
MFEGIKEGLRKLITAGFASDKLVDEVIKEIQRAMIQSDVDVKLVFDFTEKVKSRIKKEKGKGITQRERVVSVIYDSLVELLGEKGHKIEIDKKPFKILLVGLFGSGKTTTAAKMAKFFQKRGYKVALLALDTFRPAAYEQLQQLSEQIHAPFMGVKNEKNPVKIIKNFENDFKKYDVILSDSAGRDALDNKLRKEIADIKNALKPEEVLLVVPADLGQNAKVQAEEFHKLLEVTGVIVTKTEGTAKAGGALTSCAVTGAQIKFLGTGEKVDALEEFEPKRYVSRLLGMGDLQTLLEKAEEVIDKEKAEKISKKMVKGDFTLIDFYEQLKSMKKMGPLNKVMGLIPGAGMAKIPKELLNVQEENLKKFKYIIESMTPEEKQDPKILSASRVERIAKGSGTDTKTVRELISQYNKIKKMMKGFGGRKMKKLMRQFGGKIDPSMFGAT